MENPQSALQGQGHPRLTEPTQQSFLFVDADEQKASRQGRRNARSFVMQRARKERPWSTSKHAAKQRAQGRASPRSVGALGPSSAPSTATSTCVVAPARPGYDFVAKQESHAFFRQNVCLVCWTVFGSNGQKHCPICRLVSVREPNSTLHDPFQASSVPLDRSVLDLLKHCKYTQAKLSAQLKFTDQILETMLCIGVS